MNFSSEKTYGIVVWVFIILVACFMLSACSRKTPVEIAFDDVSKAVVDVQLSLPKECQTEVVLTKINSIEAKRQVAQSVCSEKIKEVESKYERVLFALIITIFAFFLRFLSKIKKI